MPAAGTTAHRMYLEFFNCLALGKDATQARTKIGMEQILRHRDHDGAEHDKWQNKEKCRPLVCRANSGCSRSQVRHGVPDGRVTGLSCYSQMREESRS